MRKYVIDAHQHFWDPSELGLPPPSPEVNILGRVYLPYDLRGEINAVGVDYTVLIQGYPQTLATNRWLFRQANATDYVIGVVAWMNLEELSIAELVLDELQKESKFVGIRHIIEDEPDVKWIVRGAVLESLLELARRDIAFDMLIKPQHLKYVLKVLDKVPNLRMVIDHIAKPNIAKGGSPGWREDLTAISQHPQAYCKLSGMITEADWHKWKASDLAPYVHHVIDVFGWDRVMFGSDWPVCLLAGDYQKVWNAINEILRDISDEQRAKVFGINAIRFYKLKLARNKYVKA